MFFAEAGVSKVMGVMGTTSFLDFTWEIFNLVYPLLTHMKSVVFGEFVCPRITEKQLWEGLHLSLSTFFFFAYPNVHDPQHVVPVCVHGKGLWFVLKVTNKAVPASKHNAFFSLVRRKQKSYPKYLNHLFQKVACLFCYKLCSTFTTALLWYTL